MYDALDSLKIWYLDSTWIERSSFWTASKEPNDKFECPLSSTEQIERSGQRKTAKIDQS